MSITVPPDFRHGFLWRNNAMTDLGPFAVDLVDIPGPKINNSDQVIGLAPGAGGHASLAVQFLQCRGKPDHWGGEEYAFHTGSTMCKYGCATTALAMAFNAAGISSIPDTNTSSAPQDEQGVTMRAMDPGNLNAYMNSATIVEARRCRSTCWCRLVEGGRMSRFRFRGSRCRSRDSLPALARA